MSSFLRRIQRKVARKNKTFEPMPQATVVYDDGSYHTLRPTKGWIYFSIKRVRAERLMAAHFERASVRDMSIMRRAKKSPKIYHTPKPVPPSTETRQQRPNKDGSCIMPLLNVNDKESCIDTQQDDACDVPESCDDHGSKPINCEFKSEPDDDCNNCSD